MEYFKIAVCQVMPTEDKHKNIERSRNMIGEAAANGANVIALGEMFNCPYLNRFFPKFAESAPEGETFKMLQESARDNSVYIVGGSIPELSGNTIYNTSFIFGPDGELKARHRKMHLFDVDIKGGIRFKESDTLGKGSDITVYDTKYCRMGTAICYDIRFPELLRLMVLDGAEVIIIPAAFNMTTGPAHWDMLFRARAVDNQVYMVGASPARDENGEYKAYGNSIVVSPWGDVISRAGYGEEIIYADIDGKVLKKVREELPLLKHRRCDIYDVVRR